MQTKLNYLKKLNQSLTKENIKLRESIKYCPGCKVELMFNTDREERDRRERNRNGARNDAEHSDDDAESQKTEISTTTNDQDIYGDAKPQVARNIRNDGRRRNRPSKQSANAEADYLSMSSTQMRNHLETIENLVEENNQMKEQVGQRIKETHHHQFLANEY